MKGRRKFRSRKNFYILDELQIQHIETTESLLMMVVFLYQKKKETKP